MSIIYSFWFHVYCLVFDQQFHDRCSAVFAGTASVSLKFSLRGAPFSCGRNSFVIAIGMAESVRMNDAIPKDLRNLRACLLCSIIKSFDQFQKTGCENCEEYLAMRGQPDAVYEYTSSNFDGCVAMMNPQQSWVAKWQRIVPYVPGLYAVSVSGKLPAAIVRELKGHGIHYKPRDSTQGPS